MITLAPTISTELSSVFSGHDQDFLDAIISSAVLLDAEGTIVLANATWIDSARRNLMAHPDFGIGVNYLDICRQATGRWQDHAHVVAAGLEDVLAGWRPHFIHVYPCPDARGRPDWFEMIAGPVHAADRSIDGALVQHVDLSRRDESALGRLTSRETAVLTGVVEGLSNKQIARREGISESGVKFHLHKIYPKLGVTNRAQAATAGERLMIAGCEPAPQPMGKIHPCD